MNERYVRLFFFNIFKLNEVLLCCAQDKKKSKVTPEPEPEPETLEDEAPIETDDKVRYYKIFII